LLASEATISVRKYPQRKVQQFHRLAELVQKYHVIALARLTKVRSTQIMEIRKSMRGQLELFVAKNKIAIKSLSSAPKPGLEAFLKSLSGQNLYIFTNMNPFELNLLLERNKVLLPAKAGDIASDQIIVPAGNTGLPPGPILSEFKDNKVVTKIEGGSIWVSKDTVVAEPGTIITPRLASLLSKLGIKPIKAGLSLDLVYWNGLILTNKDIHIDLVQYRNEIEVAARNAFNVAYNSGYPASKEVTTIIIAETVAKALNLAIKANYVTKETADTLLREAELKAYRTLQLATEKGFSG
jgi:large subunit ribosomal protein L10